MRRLLFPEPAEGTGASEPAPAAPVTSQAAAPAPAPPAAQTVVDGEVTEETLRLREQLAASEAARKKVEQDNAAVTDEFTRYKATVENPQPVAVVKRQARPASKPEKSLRLGKFV